MRSPGRLDLAAAILPESRRADHSRLDSLDICSILDRSTRAITPEGPTTSKSQPALPRHQEFLVRRIARTRDLILARLINSFLADDDDETRFLARLRHLSVQPTRPREPDHIVALQATRLWQEWEYWRENPRTEQRWE